MEAKYATSHPSTPERFVMLEQTIKDIDGKKSAKISLVPEEKAKQPIEVPVEKPEGTAYNPE
jgi:hypothetical protein